MAENKVVALNLGPVTSYGLAKSKGFPGTEEAWVEKMMATATDDDVDALDEKIDDLDTKVDTQVETINATIEQEVGAVDTKADGIAANLTTLSGVVAQKMDTTVAQASFVPVPSASGAQGDALRNNGDGTTAWAPIGLPTDEQTGTAINAWLTAHPEATTTVQDGAITRAKLITDLQEKTDLAQNATAPAFDATVAYAPGAHVTYAGKLYVLPSGHEANVTWADTTKTEVNLGGEVADLKSAIKAALEDGGIIVPFTSADVNESIYLSTSGYTAIINQGGISRMLAIECEPSTTYIIRKRTSAVFRIGYFERAEITSGKIVPGFQNLTTATEGTITTSKDAIWLLLCYWVNNGSSGDIDILNSIMIVEASKTSELAEQIVSNKASIDVNAENIASNSRLIDEQGLSMSGIVSSFPSEMYDTESNDYIVPWEQGGINVDGSLFNSLSRIRSDFIPLGHGIICTPSDATPVNHWWTRVYASDKSFLGTANPDSNGNLVVSQNFTQGLIRVDTAVNAYANAKYIRLVAANHENTGNPVLPDENGMTVTYSKCVYKGGKLADYFAGPKADYFSDNEKSFMYDVAGGYQTKGWLKLPSNYTPSGSPVPLVVFVHGSGDIYSINADTMTGHYQDYYNFIRDNGYAVFDCYGMSTKYSGGHANTLGLPINDNCYLSGINYVCDKYNIDRHNIFVACKSLGGLEAFKMLLSPAFNIKAVGMLAPELWMLNMRLTYTAADRQIVRSELEFSEDTGNVCDFEQADSIPEGYYDYLVANYDKWIGIFPNFMGLPIKVADIEQYFFTNRGLTREMARASQLRPVKIWIAEDDVAVNYGTASDVVKSLQNAGCHAELRTMPNGTGGHHAVDNDANALQTTNVTTSLGIQYATIPTAYYEMVKFFDQFRSR